MSSILKMMNYIVGLMQLLCCVTLIIRRRVLRPLLLIASNHCTQLLRFRNGATCLLKNPADLASLGVPPKNCVSADVWFNGAIFLLCYSIYRRDGVVIRASALQSVELGLISQVESYQKTLASLLGTQQIGIVWRTSRQACLLCPWARHLTGCLHFYVADRWWGQAVYPSWWSQSN